MDTTRRVCEIMKDCGIKDTPESIAFKMLNWHGGYSFSAATCGECGTKVNTHHETHGWFCPQCRQYNGNSRCHAMVWDNPDYGPTPEMISKGSRIAIEWVKAHPKFTNDQLVLARTDERSKWKNARIVCMSPYIYHCLVVMYVVEIDGKTVTINQRHIKASS